MTVWIFWISVSVAERWEPGNQSESSGSGTAPSPGGSYWLKGTSLYQNYTGICFSGGVLKQSNLNTCTEVAKKLLSSLSSLDNIKGAYSSLYRAQHLEVCPDFSQALRSDHTSQLQRNGQR